MLLVRLPRLLSQHQVLGQPLALEIFESSLLEVEEWVVQVITDLRFIQEVPAVVAEYGTVQFLS
jgi:hypothetical protein